MLRPGGQLLFLEHVLAEPGNLRRAQKIADATLWPRLFGGCHTSRDTLDAITVAGFILGEVHQFRLPPNGPTSLASPHIRGSAARPSEVMSQ